MITRPCMRLRKRYGLLRYGKGESEGKRSGVGMAVVEVGDANQVLDLQAG